MKLKKSAVVAVGAIMAIGMATPAVADANAQGTAANSPGVLSGNVIQVPVHVPVNACGNSLNLIALLNSASGNACTNN